MTHTPSLWSFVSHADLTVKLVLILLTLASVFSWTLILAKIRHLKDAQDRILSFNKRFATVDSLEDCFHAFGRPPADGSARLFYDAYAEFQRLLSLPHLDRQATQDMIQSVLDRTHKQLLDELETHCDWLATIGSVSPYVGLFGTVWGIMSSFRSLGTVQSASIAMVAPGIAEALIATAIGLFTAIPAVIAYNRFSHSIGLIDQSLDTFKATVLPQLLERWLAHHHSDGWNHD